MIGLTAPELIGLFIGIAAALLLLIDSQKDRRR